MTPYVPKGITGYDDDDDDERIKKKTRKTCECCYGIKEPVPGQNIIQLSSWQVCN